MALVVLWDGRRRRDRCGGSPGGCRVPRGLLLVALAVPYAVVLALPGRSSPWLDLGMAVPGALALGAVLRPPPPPGPDGTPPPPGGTPGPARRTDGDEPCPAGRGRPGDRGRRGWVAWPLLALLLALLELGAFLSQASPTTDNLEHPTVSAVLEPLLGGHLARAVALFVWLLLGAWLVRAIEEEGP